MKMEAQTGMRATNQAMSVASANFRMHRLYICSSWREHNSIHALISASDLLNCERVSCSCLKLTGCQHLLQYPQERNLYSIALVQPSSII